MTNACRRALRRSVAVLTAGVAIAATGVAGYAVHSYLTSSPRFAIATIEVHGNHGLTADEIRGLLRVRPGDNVFVADVHAEAAALGAEPWIRRAEVRRQLPATLVIEVEERTAAAVVALDALYFADADGVLFRRCDDEYAAELPLVTGLTRAAFGIDTDAGGAAVRVALATITTWRADPRRPPVDEIHVDGRGGLALRTHDGMSIELGADADDIAARLRRFDLAWGHLAEADRRRTRTIHLDHDTRPDHVIVAFKD